MGRAGEGYAFFGRHFVSGVGTTEVFDRLHSSSRHHSPL